MLRPQLRPVVPRVETPHWVLCAWLAACSGSGSPPNADSYGQAQSTASSNSATSGAGGSGVIETTGTTAAVSTSTAATSATTSSTMSGSGGVASTAGTTTTGTGGTASTGVPLDELSMSAVPGNGTIGLEWPAIEGALGYNVYWSTTPGVTPATGTLVSGAPRGFVHRELTNEQPYYYVVTALLADGESAPSAEISASPGGEWVLEQLGTGDFDDIVTGNPVATIPVEQRMHILLLGEGYTTGDLPLFHDHADHQQARRNDVDRWVDLVFGIEPYSLFPQAFVVWYLPRASRTSIRDADPDTAFQVPLTFGGSLPQMARPEATGPTSQRLFAALAQHPYASSTSSGERGSLRNFVASFLIFDPERGQASVSGLSTSLSNPENTSVRIDTAFGLGHAHEFTHAFAGLRDEYLENDNSAPNNWSGTSNVVGTNVCSELPWAHLLQGSAINPDVPDLIGAFGTPSIGYHSELLCLLNGTHDNGEYYASAGGSCQASSCTLRVEDRMCNFCREISTYRTLSRSGVLDNGDTGFQLWQDQYRSAFYERFGLLVPGVDFPGSVPQSNDVRNPDQGQRIFEDCIP
jgi:hypothetical protein